jgi:adenine-specific DNA-methyltransferase
VSKQKDLGQVFTPTYVVKTILDELNYVSNNINILQHKIMEPSFGEGAFFYEIIDRLITAAKKYDLTQEQILVTLNNNIFGVEYDKELFIKTKNELNDYLTSKGLKPIAWENLVNEDSLTYQTNNLFDYVVGNPPYIRIHNMDPVMRESVKNYTHSQGAVDLYVIFYELGLTWLNDTGKLGFITPNSYMKNHSQKRFRDHLVADKILVKVIDYGTKPMFNNAATYTAITILDKGNKLNQVHFESRNDVNNYDVTVPYSTLINKPWVFPSYEDQVFLLKNTTGKKLGDICIAKYGVCTLSNKTFLNFPSNIEKELLKPAVKASKYVGNNMELIIFPYELKNGKQILLPEKDFKEFYPNGYAYLEKHKEHLLTRDSDKHAAWYQYGRSQSLSSVQERKLVISSVIRSNQTTINTYIVPAGTVVYAGFFFTELENGPTLEEIKKIVESEEFCRYVKLHGKDMAGGFKAITPKIMKNYGI